MNGGFGATKHVDWMLCIPKSAILSKMLNRKLN
jgi:hypothetical protein